MKYNRAEQKAIDAQYRMRQAFDEVVRVIHEEGVSVTSGSDLVGEMAALPVEQTSTGEWVIMIDNVGLGVVTYRDENILETEWDCPPDVEFLVPHWHPATERVHVISGSCHFPELDHVLLPGDTYVVPRGQKHVWKAGPHGCKMTVTWTPPLHLDAGFGPAE